MDEDFLDQIEKELEALERDESADIRSALLLLNSAAAAVGGTNALAERLGVTRSAISKWRAGVSTPTAKNAKKINILAKIKKP